MNQDPGAARFTPAAACRFSQNKNGFLCLTLNGEDQGRVNLRRALPFTAPAQYLSVTDLEGKELALLEDLAALAPDQRALLEQALEAYYFCPVITQLRGVKNKMGAYYIDALADGFAKTIAVKDVSRNLRVLEGSKVILTDVDGNRYVIPDIYAVQRKSLRMLEPYLY